MLVDDVSRITGTAKPVASSGLAASKVGTIKRPDGHLPVTYNGFALYRYAAETDPSHPSIAGS
jgi:hypothetical protein